MMYLLTLTCTVSLLVGFVHSATLALPTGDVFYVKTSGVKTFVEANQTCDGLRGTLVSITTEGLRDELIEFLKVNPGASVNKEVWTTAAKIEEKDGYYWNANENIPVNETITPFDKRSSCNDDCCNVKWSASSNLLTAVKCDLPTQKARQLCFVFPMTKVQESIDAVNTLMALQEDTRKQLLDQVAKLSQLASSQKTQMESVTKANSTLYVLFSLSMVAVIALGIFSVVIWKKLK